MTNGGLYRVGPFVAVAGTLALLAGCGRFGVFEQRDPWRAEAELQCLQAGLVKPSIFVQPRSAISGPGVCGMDHPFQVMAYAGGAVAVAQKLTLACPMISRADQWVEEVVQPIARASYGQPVAQIKAGSYSCRSQNNQRGARLSEHSFGNAMDVFSFTFADGREIVVKTGWRGAPDEQQFLRQVFVNSCRYFTTVLGPGADMFHYDHFHLDLARHDPRGLRSICKPVIKFDPMPGEGRIDRPLMSYRAPPPSQPATAVAAAPIAAPGG
ncbi:MAG: extensin, partial [Rhizobiales bacterium 65-9]